MTDSRLPTWFSKFQKDPQRDFLSFNTILTGIFWVSMRSSIRFSKFHCDFSKFQDELFDDYCCSRWFVSLAFLLIVIGGGGIASTKLIKKTNQDKRRRHQWGELESMPCGCGWRVRPLLWSASTVLAPCAAAPLTRQHSNQPKENGLQGSLILTIWWRVVRLHG